MLHREPPGNASTEHHSPTGRLSSTRSGPPARPSTASSRGGEGRPYHDITDEGSVSVGAQSPRHLSLTSTPHGPRRRDMISDTRRWAGHESTQTFGSERFTGNFLHYRKYNYPPPSCGSRRAYGSCVDTEAVGGAVPQKIRKKNTSYYMSVFSRSVHKSRNIMPTHSWTRWWKVSSSSRVPGARRLRDSTTVDERDLYRGVRGPPSGSAE